ncbi:hypothetical protein D9M70_603260 [compost metagenome]
MTDLARRSAGTLATRADSRLVAECGCGTRSKRACARSRLRCRVAAIRMMHLLWITRVGLPRAAVQVLKV